MKIGKKAKVFLTKRENTYNDFLFYKKNTMNTSSLSWKENTPEFQQAIELAFNKWKWDYSFYTTWWHVITKILEDWIVINFPNWNQIVVFNSYSEVMDYFKLTPDLLGKKPNTRLFEISIWNLRRKIQPLKEENSKDIKQIYENLFQTKIIDKLWENDSLEILINLLNWLKKFDSNINNDLVIENLIDFILDKEWLSLEDFQDSELKIKDLDIERIKEYFVDCMLDLLFNIPLNKVMSEVENRLISLVRIPLESVQELVKSDIYSKLRNTRYI